MSRRVFAGGAAALGVGAAMGVPILGEVKTHGPVKIWTYLFSEKPSCTDVILFADKDKDVFGVRVFFDGKETGMAKLPLSNVKWAIANELQACLATEVTMSSSAGIVEKHVMDMLSKDQKLTFIGYNKDLSETKYWLDLADVRRVL